MDKKRKRLLPVLIFPLLLALFGCRASPGEAKASLSPKAETAFPGSVALSFPAETIPEETEALDGASSGEGTGENPGDRAVVTLDGITFAGGQIIVNKTYPLPKDYCPPLTSEDLGAAFPVTPETRLAFLAMREAAQKEGLWLFSVSSYRTYDLQEMLYNGYAARDGREAADRYSARPGHSEHQTGLAIDLNSCEAGFEDTPEGIWIAEHCVEFGFILRYPAGKEEVTGYMYEPWHIRYVGSRELAEAIASAGTMEEYYGLTSVYSD